MFLDSFHRAHKQDVQEDDVLHADANDDHDDDNDDSDCDVPLQQLPITLEPQLRRATRQRQPSSKHPTREFMTLANGKGLETYKKAISHKHQNEWYNTRQIEVNSLCKNYKSNVLELPKGKRTLKNMWMFSWKYRENSILP